jgi:DtxR family Mn-dependent transcriptional regulator
MCSACSRSRSEGARRLSSLARGARGVIASVLVDDRVRAARLAALGVTPGAPIVVLQTFPSVVFECDQTELAVEPGVARAILVDVAAGAPS